MNIIKIILIIILNIFRLPIYLIVEFDLLGKLDNIILSLDKEKIIEKVIDRIK
jgi:hypothetical protein